MNDLERDLGAALPPGYREFLLTCNGGIPAEHRVDVPGLPGSPTDVQLFLGVGGDQVPSIRWFLDAFPNLRSAGAVPIAIDSGGNTFFLMLRDGSVVYTDEQETMFPVAPSFDAFTELLRPWNP